MRALNFYSFVILGLAPQAAFARFTRSKNHFTFPVTMAGDADDEGFRESSGVAVTSRD